MYECPYCEHWSTKSKGAFTRHIKIHLTDEEIDQEEDLENLEEDLEEDLEIKEILPYEEEERGWL